ncbi:hypothetical protein OSB04_025066 [Centaurea solstitialis]|uniref:Pentatricopeptide repeat-containing protein n=1 Tax=Centaurea solstitialis TaxID=347529 RepID=A0AA38WCQ1_9ASTR|nr:hypothetical protein OSB04_025066 [Centaurea solstitialis]
MAISTLTSIVSTSAIRRRLPIVGAFCMLSLGLHNLHSSSSHLSFNPLTRLRLGSKAQGFHSSGVRMEASNQTTVPSIVVYVTVPNKEAVAAAVEVEHSSSKYAPVMHNIMHMKYVRSHWFSTSSKEPSLVPWISPYHYIRAKSPRPDPPAEPSDTITEVPKKSKYISHESAIKLIKREKDPHHVLRIFDMVANQRGFNHNHSTYAVTLHKLARSKKFKDVDSVLHQMTYETCKFHESIFLDLMTHFSKASLHKRVVEMFNAIQPIVREKPSLKAISTCLNLLVESNQVDLARTFLLHTKKTLNMYPNTCIFNILVKHHCKHGNCESAFEVVKEMKLSDVSYPNLITYSTLMEGLCKEGRLEEAVNLFEEMVSKDKIVPDALTYNILIHGFCRGGKVDRAMKIMDFMRKNGCNPNIFNYSTLMNGFCKEGNLQEAKRVFNEMKGAGLRPDKVGFTTLINCLCRAGKVDEAMEFLKEMEEQDCKGDTVTFNIILVGLCKEGRTYDALEMLERLPYEGVYLDKSGYRIVLNSLCNLGDLQKATELVGVMMSRGFVPHFATSNELLASLCEAGRAADAAMVLLGLVEMGFNPNRECGVILLR